MKKATVLALAILLSGPSWSDSALVFQSDFGNKDGAVAAMKGVAVTVSPSLRIFDLTHEIPAFNIWEAALQLEQTAGYWPPGTVFVSVVDPGVGTERKSVVLKTKTGHYFVTPDNGTLTFVAEHMGIDTVREIDEAVNRLSNSEASYTFHGRDVYAYTGARLAAGVMSFTDVGPELPANVVAIPYQKSSAREGALYGNIVILDVQYGNVWTNIDRNTFFKLPIAPGDELQVTITDGEAPVLETAIPYYTTFGAVSIGEPLLYLNSLNNVALAINQGNFADRFAIRSGPGWNIKISKKGSKHEN